MKKGTKIAAGVAGAVLAVGIPGGIAYNNYVFSVRSPNENGYLRNPFVLNTDQARQPLAPKPIDNLRIATAQEVQVVVNGLKQLPPTEGCPDRSKPGEVIQVGEGPTAGVVCLDLAHVTERSSGGETWIVTPALAPAAQGYLQKDLARTYADRTQVTDEMCAQVTVNLGNLAMAKIKLIDPGAYEDKNYLFQPVLDASTPSRCDGKPPVEIVAGGAH